jgi:hypothetical protein
MAIYDLPGIINISLHLAATPANIKAVFKVAVIYPYNRNAFPEEEFLPSYVTDRLYPEALEHRMAREYRLMRQHNRVFPTSILQNQFLLTISFLNHVLPQV